MKTYEIWVDWQTEEPAYTTHDFMEVLNVFAGIIKASTEHVEVRCEGKVIAEAPVKEE